MMIIISPYIPHHDVDKGVLYEGEEDKEGAGGHEHVDGLDVGDWRQRLLTAGVLGGESEEGGDPQRDPGGDSLRLDPEADPGHHHDQTGRDVSVEHEVAEKIHHRNLLL